MQAAAQHLTGKPIYQDRQAFDLRIAIRKLN
jgi:hypothetical protein